eukprot:Clim_evm74s152 gene=Clim_evmTU74s152
MIPDSPAPNWRNFELMVSGTIPRDTQGLCRGRISSFCPTRDLLALSGPKCAFSLYRVATNKWEKVWEVTYKQAGLQAQIQTHSKLGVTAHVTSICWRPDGNVLAVAWSVGLLSLHHVEDGSTLLVHEESSGICSRMLWILLPRAKMTGFPPGQDQFSDFVSIARAAERCGTETTEPSKNTEGIEADEDIYSVLVKGTCDEANMTVLVTQGINGSVKLLLNGIVETSECQQRMGIDDVTELNDTALNTIQKSCISEWCGPECALYTQFSNDIDPSGQTPLVRIDMPLLIKNQGGLQLLITYDVAIKQFFDSCRKCLSDVEIIWGELVQQLTTKFLGYPGSQDALRADLFVFLTTARSPCEEFGHFISNRLSEVGLRRLLTSFDGGFREMRDKFMKVLLPNLEMLTASCNVLRGLARWRQRFGVLGLSADAVEQCLRQSQQLLVLAEVVSQSMADLQSQLHFFLAKLGQTVAVVSQENAAPEAVEEARRKWREFLNAGRCTTMRPSVLGFGEMDEEEIVRVVTHRFLSVQDVSETIDITGMLQNSTSANLPLSGIPSSLQEASISDLVHLQDTENLTADTNNYIDAFLKDKTDLTDYAYVDLGNDQSLSQAMGDFSRAHAYLQNSIRPHLSLQATTSDSRMMPWTAGGVEADPQWVSLHPRVMVPLDADGKEIAVVQAHCLETGSDSLTLQNCNAVSVQRVVHMSTVLQYDQDMYSCMVHDICPYTSDEFAVLAAVTVCKRDPRDRNALVGLVGFGVLMILLDSEEVRARIFDDTELLDQVPIRALTDQRNVRLRVSAGKRGLCALISDHSNQCSVLDLCSEEEDEEDEDELGGHLIDQSMVTIDVTMQSSGSQHDA